MKTTNRIRLANLLRNCSRYILLVLGIMVFVFALLSGSEEFGGGLKGIIQNSPNAIPWLGLLILVFIAWKSELAGGILITVSGLFMIYFFNFSGPNFFPVTFILTVLITILGAFFIVSWYLRRDPK